MSALEYVQGPFSLDTSNDVTPTLVTCRIAKETGTGLMDAIKKFQLAPTIGHVACDYGGKRYALGFVLDQELPDTLWAPEAIKPEDHQRPIDSQSKGRGIRAYNTPNGPLGLKEEGPIGAYLFNIDQPVKIADERGSSVHAGTMRKVARHAGRMVHSMLPGGSDRIQSNLDKRFGDADIVLQHQPPRALMRQVMRGGTEVDRMDTAFALIRNPKIPLFKLGEVSRR